MSFQGQAFDRVEQDHSGAGDELPTYDDLAASNGPNSRFGRWQGWIEKRAAERYRDVTPQERQRRRERGWGNEIDPTYQDQQQDLPSRAIPPPLPPRSINVPAPMIVHEPPTPQPTLQIRTMNLVQQESEAEAPPDTPPLPALPFLPQRLKPTHLKMFNFGSRFLPHSTTPIRCLLPILSDRLILIGHDEGLSVLDIYHQTWDSAGHVVQHGPDEAQARAIWLGEGVFQMTVLEAESTGDGTPQGVVLALVGPGPAQGRDSESVRSLRMYNLSSLTSLAKWAVANKGSKPLDLAHAAPNWSTQSTPTKKRHRPTSSFAKSLRNLIEQPRQDHSEPSSSSYHNLLSPTASLRSHTSITGRNGQASPTPSLGSLREGSSEGHDRSPDEGRPSTPTRGDSWDIIDDLPLRWATDFVPLASAGSRLLHASILSYALWKDEARKGTGGQLLAVATKSNILLYETPKGERAFHFVKEFYTPLTPRSITFFQQAVHEMARSSSDASARHHGHRRSNSGSSMHVTSESPRAAHTIDYGIHTSLFVVFEKKAGWIRLADSAVGEWELWDDPSSNVSLHANPSVVSNASRRSRASSDVTPHHPKWTPPARVHLEMGEGRTQDLYLLTKGLLSHLLPCPLPTHSLPPLHAVIWQAPPSSVTVRLCGMSAYDDGDEPFMQLIALGEDGVEVREIPLAALMTKGKGKGRARPVEERSAFEDVGGGAAFMCTGGHWDNPERAYYSSTMAQGYMNAMSPPGLSSSLSPGGLRYSASMSSTSTYGSVDTDRMVSDLKREQGVYGVCRKSLDDWRVFWVGGSAMYEDDDDEEPLNGDF
ncbi:hypothetical protein BD626DRAFT_479986 [Schizophyllum amplum]|uniref:Uncharacterized protein n=1 Tax=Schizophyllum amplum TaxID=97359 RepID=A0A550CSR8_9AGAR|nr:hypothetical protein BD626DRAFT_479986 [Auriculariopsis ampla]